MTGGLFPVPTTDYAIGMAWLVVLATYGGWLIYDQLLRLYPPAMVSATVYLSPPVTLLWAWVTFDEPLSWAMALGHGVTLAGVAMVATGRRACTAAPAE